jgi:putative dimethyl sulfoxide reductase chaperone
MLTSYPDESFVENAKLLIEGEVACKQFCLIASEEWETINSYLLELISDTLKIDDLRSDYIDIFDRSQATNPLYESDYGQNQAMAKGHELADIAAFYHAFGLEFDSENKTKEMLDHVSIELEFYAYLLAKQEFLKAGNDLDGVDIVYDARKKFMKDHLGRFVSVIASRPGVKIHKFYSAVFRWCSRMIKLECENLDVEPVPANFYGQKNPEKETMTCGTLGDCTLDILKR